MEDAQPSGIGGWLLFFSLMLALNMLVSFYNYAIAALIAVHMPALFAVVLPYCILGIPISFYGLWAVFLLFSKQPSAIFHVKLFLILYAAVSILVSILAFSLAPSDMLPAIASWYRTLEFRVANLLYCAIWFWYFSVSKRVKNTYGVVQAI
jgi:hypothetical protein